MRSMKESQRLFDLPTSSSIDVSPIKWRQHNRKMYNNKKLIVDNQDWIINIGKWSCTRMTYMTVDNSSVNHEWSLVVSYSRKL